MPVASEIALSLGYPPRSNGSARIAFAALTGYWYFSSIFLTGLATNFFVVQLLSAPDRARVSWLGCVAGAAPGGILSLTRATIALPPLSRPGSARTRLHGAPPRQRGLLGPRTGGR